MSTASPLIDDHEYAALESAVNAFLDQYEASGSKGVGYLLRRPRRTAAAFASARRLPVLQVRTSATPEGRAVRHELSRGVGRLRTPLHTVSGAVAVPDDSTQYELGASKQTLRRKVRAAQKRGITWEAVTDPVLRRELVDLADEHERNNPHALYRADSPSNEDLLDYDLWLLARAADGSPLLLSVTPIDDGVGALRYFRTLRADDDASLARYLMTQVLITELSRRGVHHLVDTTISMHLSHGLRHFQRMVGFRLIRLEVCED
ncbi:hypothetical protein [Amnibacterium sp.]|uniref:hypothetical protein n=1 Tax=Amnibacterium sp. TaxID=1872496 RepID=UPI003F7CBE48